MNPNNPERASVPRIIARVFVVLVLIGLLVFLIYQLVHHAPSKPKPAPKVATHSSTTTNKTPSTPSNKQPSNSNNAPSSTPPPSSSSSSSPSSSSSSSPSTPSNTSSTATNQPLANTGPGDIIGLFLSVTGAGMLIHEGWRALKLRRQS